MDRERAALLLGVAVDAGRAEVTAAFARRARTAHPDVDGGDAETFRLLVEARDRLLAAGPAPGGAPRAAPKCSPRRFPAPARRC